MTIVCWDGKTLAADKLRTTVGLKSTATKIYRLSMGELVGFSGSEVHAMRLLKWFKDFRGGEFPAPIGDDTGADALFIETSGDAWFYHSTCGGVGIKRDDPFLAMGAGRDYALAAMHLGFDARKAVEVACHFDAGCGNGIDTLTLEK